MWRKWVRAVELVVRAVVGGLVAFDGCVEECVERERLGLRQEDIVSWSVQIRLQLIA